MHTASHEPLLAGFLTLNELATELGVDPRTIARWRLRREGPPACRMHGRLLFKRADVLQWIESRKEVAA